MVKTEAAETLFARAHVVDALAFLSLQVEEAFTPASKTAIVEQPVRKVTAKAAFDICELVLASALS